MITITAPHYSLVQGRSLFLAGGISGCGDWHQDVIAACKDAPITILNPRRPGTMNRKDVELSRQQIAWEHTYLRLASEVLFWFPDTSVCPIALFELGGALERRGQFKRLYVGCAEGYDRIVDLQVQLELAKFKGELVHSVNGLVKQVLTN